MKMMDTRCPSNIHRVHEPDSQKLLKVFCARRAPVPVRKPFRIRLLRPIAHYALPEPILLSIQQRLLQQQRLRPRQRKPFQAQTKRLSTKTHSAVSFSKISLRTKISTKKSISTNQFPSQKRRPRPQAIHRPANKYTPKYSESINRSPVRLDKNSLKLSLRNITRVKIY